MRLSNYIRFGVDEILQLQQSQLMQPTVYDTAWAARLTDPHGTPAYPNALRWVMERQHPDGSWGSQVPFIHDRILSTLMMVVLLARVGNRQHDHIQRLAGERYLWQNCGRLHYDRDATVGFELILPALLQEAKALGLNVPFNQFQAVEQERTRKLLLLPMESLLLQRTTALFSLEAFGDMLELTPNTTRDLLLANGSMAVSPSATAFLLSQSPNWRTDYPTSVRYLDELMATHGGGLPHVAPYDIFSRAWMLANLHYGKLTDQHSTAVRPHIAYLLQHWQSDGVGFSALDSVRDSDDTVLVALALHRNGHPVDVSPLNRYERATHFACYDHEKDPSVSTNLHILEALELFPAADQKRIQTKIVGYLLGARKSEAFWTDKWHVSAYYPTSLALLILSRHVPEAMLDTLHWVENTQQLDGGWGIYGSTAEETAMTLIALIHYHQTIAAINLDIIKRAADYLLQHEQPFQSAYPELWISKVLYAPTPIVRSTILAALALYNDLQNGH